MNSVFATVENIPATPDSHRLYFLPREYKVRIDQVLVHPKRLGGHLFVVETTCLESNNPEILPGNRRNWAQSMDMEAAIPRIKCFLGAAHGFCPKRRVDQINEFITQEVCDLAVSIKNPLQGTVLNLECYNKKSLRTGKDFTIHSWSPLSKEELPEALCP